jgi:hypothetical protein
MKKVAKKATKRGRPAKKSIVIDDFPSNVYDVAGEQIEDTFLAMRVCNNPNWIIVRMDGLAVPVKCPSRMSNKLVGKRIKLCLVSAEPEDYYEYVS